MVAGLKADVSQVWDLQNQMPPGDACDEYTQRRPGEQHSRAGRIHDGEGPFPGLACVVYPEIKDLSVAPTPQVISLLDGAL